MKWNLKKKAPKKFLDKFAHLDPLLVQLLYARGLTDKKEIEAFLQPDYTDHTHDPYLMKGMKKAVARIKKARREGEKIAIYGDYDADGVCAATILNKVLTKLGFDPEVYIPDRQKEGYGLNEMGIEYLKKQGIDLIITVDCGMSDQKEVKLAHQKGMEVILTDHHLIPDQLPSCEIILNPHQKDCSYPYDFLSGAGVAFKLAQALIHNFQDEFLQGYEKWLLDLVSLATVADLMPVCGENRTLVKYGLIVMSKTRCLGLKALAECAGIEQLSPETLTSRTLGFILGPRLNAAGRMDHANLSFRLLNTENAEEAKKIAQKLEKKNNKRRRLQRKIQNKLIKKLDERDKLDLILEGDASWPIGILGLIAGNVCDHYYYPACIYSFDGKICKGSCRSVKGINIVDILSGCKDLLEEYGGHSQAAGFAMEKKNLNKFEDCFAEKLKEALKGVELKPEIEIDAQVQPSEVSLKVEETIETLAPFGKGNPEPVFLMRNLQIKETRNVGTNGNHLKLKVRAPLKEAGQQNLLESNVEAYKDFDAIYFGFDSEPKQLTPNESYDIVFEPLIDEWRGEKKLTLKIVDFRESSKESRIKIQESRSRI